MAKTIPQLQEATSIDENTLFPIDSGIQSYKLSAPNLAKGLEPMMSGVLPRWDGLKEYSLGDIVNYEGMIFKSLINNNLGQNPATYPEKWRPERLSWSHIDSASGNFSKITTYIERIGSVVTITGWASQIKSGESNDPTTHYQFLPEWAIPKIDPLWIPVMSDYFAAAGIRTWLIIGYSGAYGSTSRNLSLWSRNATTSTSAPVPNGIRFSVSYIGADL